MSGLFPYDETSPTLTNEEYHARPEISKSDLDLIAKSPFHFKNKDLFKRESPALNLGSAVHKLILEADEFKDEFAVAPKIDKRTKKGKEQWQQFIDENKEKIVLSQDEYEKATNMRDAFGYVKGSGAFLKNGKPEQSFFGELDGVKVRCRPDYYREDLGLILDLKTTNDGSFKGFQKSVANFDYHMQAAFYTDVLRSLGKPANKFLFIAIEKEEPHMVSFYELDNTAVEEGREKYKRLLKLYKYCLKHDDWYGYAKFDADEEVPPTIVQTLTLPAWKFYENV